MRIAISFIVAAAAALLLAGCQTQHNPDGSVRVSSPTLGQVLGVDQGGMSAGGAPAKPGETILAQSQDGWKTVYADIRQPGKAPFRYCSLEYSPHGPGVLGGVAFQISENKGLQAVLDTDRRSFNAKASVFSGAITFSDGTKSAYRFQAVGEHVAVIPPGTLNGLDMMRHMTNSTRMSFVDARGSMLDVPTAHTGAVIKAFNRCTLDRL